MTKRIGWIGIGLWGSCFFASLLVGAGEANKKAPRIQSLLKPKIYQKVVGRPPIRGQEIISSANLSSDKEGDKTQKYEFYVTLRVPSPMKFVDPILNQYDLYQKMVPFVEMTRYDSRKKILELKGGIWNFKLHSFFQFYPRSPGWTEFEVIRGHLKGIRGHILLEPIGEGDTLVYFGGGMKGTQFPPALVMEQGAEIALSFTAKKMRSYIQEQKKQFYQKREKSHDSTLPKPRRRL